MTTSLTVSVEQEDIDAGDSTPNSCPIALAVNKMIKCGEVKVVPQDFISRVDNGKISLCHTRKAHGFVSWEARTMAQYQLPNKISRWVEQFDSCENHHCKPITFTAEKL